jgi:hypothetical protein
MEEGADVKLRRQIMIIAVDADEQIVFQEQRHLWMADVVRLAARHHEPKRLEGLPPEHLAKGIGRHQKKLHKEARNNIVTASPKSVLLFTSLSSKVAHWEQGEKTFAAAEPLR